jgi:hypothetical protein
MKTYLKREIGWQQHRMKQFLKKLRNHFDFWANPDRVIRLEREAKWVHYVNEVRLLAKELNAPDIQHYVEHILKQMEDKK